MGIFVVFKLVPCPLRITVIVYSSTVDQIQRFVIEHVQCIYHTDVTKWRTRRVICDGLLEACRLQSISEQHRS
jgi:hypothetical protein